MGSDRATLGELRGRVFAEVWTSAEYRALPEGLLGADPLAMCWGCPAYRGVSASGEGLGPGRGDIPLNGQEECVARRVDEVGLVLGRGLPLGRPTRRLDRGEVVEPQLGYARRSRPVGTR